MPDNLVVLGHGASTDFLTKLKQDLIQTIDRGDLAEAQVVLSSIASHLEDINQYSMKVRENVGSYIDSYTGAVDMERFQKIFNSYMAETFVMWYGRRDAEKAKVSMQFAPLTDMNYEKLKIADPSLFGQYTINPDTVGINFKEKQLKINILDMKEFIGKPRWGVVKEVVVKYGATHHIPGLEYQKYLLDNPDKTPQELKNDNWYYFVGSTLRARFGGSDIPYVNWDGENLIRRARWLDGRWREIDRVFLLEK